VHHPRARRRLVAVVLALAAVVVTAPAAPAAPAPLATVRDYPQAVWDLLIPVNSYRVEAGIDPVVQHQGLASIATAWARQAVTQRDPGGDPELLRKLPRDALLISDAVYLVESQTPDMAASIVATSASFNWDERGVTDVGIGVAEIRGSGDTHHYAVYVIMTAIERRGPAAGEATLYRFFRPDTGTHFYSTSVGERDSVIRSWVYRYEGPVGFVLTRSSTVPGARPLHRFLQPSTGTHFYTSTAAEHDAVLTYPQYRGEGVAAQVLSTAGAGRAPVYRFFRPGTGTHLYTSSTAERDAVLEMPEYVYEGTAFYLRPYS
jgi:GNAT superfamily N-acetyltransferase